MKTNPFISLIILSSMSLLPVSLCSASTPNAPVVTDNADNPLMFTMKGDTVVYNMDGITVTEGTSVAGVLSKFPAVLGTSTVNGKSVSDVLIDGKEFIGNIDNSALLSNLPAYMVKTIKVYEREPESVRGRSAGKATIKELVLDLQIADGYRDRFTGELEAGVGSSLSRNNAFDNKTFWSGNAFGMQSTAKSRIMASVSGNNLDSYSQFGESGNAKDGGLALNVNGLYQINKESRYQGSLQVGYDESCNQVNELTHYIDSYGNRYSKEQKTTNIYNKSLTTVHEFKYRSYNDVLGIFQNPDVRLRASASLNKKDENSTDITANGLEDYNVNAALDLYSISNGQIKQTCDRTKTNTVSLSGYAMASPINNDRIDFQLSFYLSHTDINEKENELSSGVSSNHFYGGSLFHYPTDNKNDAASVGLNMSIALDGKERHHLNFGDTYSVYSYNYDYNVYKTLNLSSLDDYSKCSVFMEPDLDGQTSGNHDYYDITKKANTFSMCYTYGNKNKWSNNETLLKVGANMPLEDECVETTLYDPWSKSEHYDHSNFFVNTYVSYQFKNVPKGLEVFLTGNATTYSYQYSEEKDNYTVYTLDAFTKFMIGRAMFNTSLDYTKYSNKELFHDRWYSNLNINMDIPFSPTDKWRIKNRIIGHYTNYEKDHYERVLSEYLSLVFRPNKKVEFSAVGYNNNDKTKYISETCTHDFYYGLTTVLELPFGIQFNADALNYGRRDYEDEDYNKDVFVLNAGLTKRFNNGKVLLSFEGHDLFGNMKPVYTEIKTSSLYYKDKNFFPSYGMMKLTYRF